MATVSACDHDDATTTVGSRVNISNDIVGHNSISPRSLRPQTIGHVLHTVYLSLSDDNCAGFVVSES